MYDNMKWFYHWYSKNLISILINDDGCNGPYKLRCILKYDCEKEARRHVDILKDAGDEDIMKIFYDPTDIHGLPWLVYTWELRES